jgi:hypothetical protein
MSKNFKGQCDCVLVVVESTCWVSSKGHVLLLGRC